MTAYQHIASNKRKSIFLIILFSLFVLVLGYVIDLGYGTGTGTAGLFYAVIFSLGMTLFSYFNGDKVALATSGAKQITAEDNPYLWRLVENLCISTGTPMPKVYVIQDSAMNAFATGRDPKHASIAVTTGLMDGLENEELEGVLAHELSHISNYDTRFLMIVAVLVGAVTLLADFMWRGHLFGSRGSNREGGNQLQLVFLAVGLVLLIVSPIIARLIQLAVSRKREALADSSAVLTTRYADGLIRALQKIDAQHAPMQRVNRATAHLYFASPFGPGKRWSRMWATHPPIPERIAALRQMGGDSSAT